MKILFNLYARSVKSWSKPGIILILFAVILLFNLLIFPFFPGICIDKKLNPSSAGMLDTKIHYSAQDVKAFLSSKTKEERECSILVHLTADLVYPLIYSIFLGILFSLLSTRLKLSNTTCTLFIAFPFFILFFDYLENIFIVILLAAPKAGVDTVTRPLAYITPVVTTIKWCFVMLNLAVLTALTTVRLFKRLKMRYTKNL